MSMASIWNEVARSERQGRFVIAWAPPLERYGLELAAAAATAAAAAAEEEESRVLEGVECCCWGWWKGRHVWSWKVQESMDCRESRGFGDMDTFVVTGKSTILVFYFNFLFFDWKRQPLLLIMLF